MLPQVFDFNFAFRHSLLLTHIDLVINFTELGPITLLLFLHRILAKNYHILFFMILLLQSW